MARNIMSQLENDTKEAQDNLLASKVTQAFHTNKGRAAEDIYRVGNKVMLSTLHWRREYKAGNKKCVAKFFPCWDSPFSVTRTFPESSYTIHQPNAPDVFPTFHSSLLKRHTENDAELFPSCKHTQPGPIVGSDRMEEYTIEKIVDERKMGQGFQYLVRLAGYSASDDLWLPRCELKDSAALDDWLACKVEGTR
jgi:hypothetical protein